MALRPVFGPWPHRIPSSNLLCALLQSSSLVPAAHLRHHSSSHFPLGFPTGLLSPKTFFWDGLRELFILITWNIGTLNSAANYKRGNADEDHFCLTYV